MMVTRNLLGGSPSPATKSGSKQTIVVGLAFFIGGGCLFEEIMQLKDFTLGHQGGATSWRRGHYGDAFYPRVAPSVIIGRWVGESRIASRSLSHGAQSGSGAASSRVAGKDGKAKSEKRWDKMCSVALSFIGAASDSVTIHSLEKDAFLFQPLVRSRRRIEEPKGWKFKRF
jgi:hypothetical protein